MKNNKMDIKQINTVYGKLPPQAIDVEEVVLGALMLESEAYSKVYPLIDERSFYKDNHQKIFAIIKSLVDKNTPVDLLMVTQELKNQGKLDEVGGTGFIARLTRNVASAANIESHARIIAQMYVKREMIKKASEILEKSYDNSIDVDDLIFVWRSSGDELESTFNVADSGSVISSVLKSTVKQIEEDCKRVSDKRTCGITTGFNSLDTNTGGWRGGNLIILAARPGIGKTSFALFFALEAAKAGYWVNIFSFEMNKEDLARIILAAESGIYRSNIRDGILNETDWPKINKAVGRLEGLPIVFRDSSGMNVHQVQANIRKNRKNGKCDFVIVDYLQLVKSSSNKQIRELEVSEISRTLKSTALNENIPILALSQLNRSADDVESPKLSHLRESGAIEQDADIVCFLSKKNESEIRFKVAKHRRGSLGEIDICRNKEMTCFSENSF